MPAYHSFNEAQTRYGLIDPKLTKRGWNLADRRSVSLEVPVDGITSFLKYVLKLEDVPHFADLAKKASDAFILEHNYNADQTRFLQTEQMVVMQKRRIDLGDLYEPLFTNFGLNAVEKLLAKEK